MSAERGIPLAWDRRDAPRAVGFVAPEAAQHVTGTPALIRDDGDGHVAVIAATGAGKGRSVLIPTLLEDPSSAVVTDPKGEAALVTARWRQRRFGHEISVLDPFHALPETFFRGLGTTRHTLNPLQMAMASIEDFADDAMGFAEICSDLPKHGNFDPFWPRSGQALVATACGLVTVRSRLMGKALPDDASPGGVFNELMAGDLDYRWAVFLDSFGGHEALPAWIRLGMESHLSHEDKVRASIRSEAVSMVRIYGTARMQSATTSTTAPIPTLRNGGAVTLYAVLPPERLLSHGAYLRATLNSLLVQMTRRSHRPERSTLFLVDELAHLGQMPELRTAVTLLRGYGVRVVLFLQSVSQLKALWPQDWQTVIENCATVLNFGNTSLQAARQVAEHLGDTQAETLYAMRSNELAVHRAGTGTRIFRRLDYLHDSHFAGRFDPHPMYR